MRRPLDDEYVGWLYRTFSPAGLVKPVRTYWKLFAALHRKEFIWLVPNDDNRAEDGQLLRTDFIEEVCADAAVNQDWLHLGCSMLELIAALSYRLAFMAEGEPRVWFWEMIKNVGLTRYSDRLASIREDDVEEILDDIIWRRYLPDGTGGLFPLQETENDQREVELWYQISEYVQQDRA